LTPLLLHSTHVLVAGLIFFSTKGFRHLGPPIFRCPPGASGKTFFYASSERSTVIFYLTLSPFCRDDPWLAFFCSQTLSPPPDLSKDCHFVPTIEGSAGVMISFCAVEEWLALEGHSCREVAPARLKDLPLPCAPFQCKAAPDRPPFGFWVVYSSDSSVFFFSKILPEVERSRLLSTTSVCATHPARTFFHLPHDRPPVFPGFNRRNPLPVETTCATPPTSTPFDVGAKPFFIYSHRLARFSVHGCHNGNFPPRYEVFGYSNEATRPVLSVAQRFPPVLRSSSAHYSPQSLSDAQKEALLLPFPHIWRARFLYVRFNPVNQVLLVSWFRTLSVPPNPPVFFFFSNDPSCVSRG